MSATYRSAAQAAAFAAALERRRKRGVVAIKTAQRQLGLDDDTYRALLEAQTRTPTSPGKRSATDLTLPEQSRVLDYMRRQGAANPNRAGRDGGRLRSAQPAIGRAELVGKVNSLLDELRRVTGEPHSLNYADAICKRNGWAERVDFCGPTQLHLLVGALSRTLRTRQAATARRAG